MEFSALNLSNHLRAMYILHLIEDLNVIRYPLILASDLNHIVTFTVFSNDKS